MLATKFFCSSNNEDQDAPWSQNPWCKDAVASREKYDELRQIVSGHNMHVTTSATTFASLCIKCDGP